MAISGVNSGIYLSVVIPVFNEEGNLRCLQDKLSKVLNQLAKDYEIIYIDDGSSDQGYQLLKQFIKEDNHVKVLRFRRNFGQTQAISAGFDAACGRVIVPLDADLQNDPEDIPRLLQKLEEGYDVVSGWRKHRLDPLLTRKIPSYIANKLIAMITGVALKDYGCTLKAYRADILKNIKLYGEMHRFIPAFCAFIGAKVVEIPVTHHPRLSGRTKYGLSRTLKVPLDLLVVKFLSGYSSKPIHIFGPLGILLCFGGIAAGVATLIKKYFFGVYVHRDPLIYLAIFLFLLGGQCVMMGLLAELNIRIYHESTGKKTYLIAEALNFEDGVLRAQGII